MAVFVRIMNGATFRAVHGTGGDMCGERSKLTLRAAGDFWVPTVIFADKPEDEFFVAVVNEKGNIKVSATGHGMVELIEAQDRCVLAGFFILMKFNHITGRIGVANPGFTFTGFS
ncbi:hypothetical protein WIH50_005599 [Salmonella enterica]|nr:hypothetical protein [Salmonella enterica]EDH5964882.1 hypothetical protein [Salmonella enterica subsp. enterica serovar Oranienburg]EDV0848080.1 hypothetical protein [Salmonella enterica subsp. enterica serovar Java]EIC4421483.1 hypothetical protein [Salmonella enterica subsp. enterica serovar Cerro]EDV9853801.1 hypothetical protein [Salmonella enterica subsp. enterica serovar Java]